VEMYERKSAKEVLDRDDVINRDKMAAADSVRTRRVHRRKEGTSNSCCDCEQYIPCADSTPPHELKRAEKKHSKMATKSTSKGRICLLSFETRKSTGMLH
jgi:ribosomal protein L34E